MWMRIAVFGVLLVLLPGPLAAETASCESGSALAEPGATKQEQLDQLLRRAITCIHERKPQAAIDIFSQMISLDPGNPTAYLDRANAYIQTGNLALGIADLSYVISLKPDFPEAWYNRGIAFLMSRNYDRAVADFGETLKLKPDFTRAYCNRGLALVRKGNYEKALADLNDGLEKDPNLVICRFARGNVFFAMKNYQAAVDDYTRGLQQKPNIEALRQRALAYEKLGEREKALADFKTVFEHSPNDEVALKGIARLNRASGQAAPPQ